MNAVPAADCQLLAKTQQLFDQRYALECRRFGRFLIYLMIGQWIAGLLFALLVSPLTWIGESYSIHVHVLAAAVIGGALSALSIYHLQTRPAAQSTRHIVAACQLLWTCLLIHLSGGRIETHFHAFASLAILSLYRDWRILITATAIVAADHLIRGIWYPLSVFGVMTESPWRWLEHAGWVSFQVAFLIPGCIRLRQEIWELCHLQSETEAAKSDVQRQVQEQTGQLTETLSRLVEFQKTLDKTLDCVFIFQAQDLRFTYVNEGAIRQVGYSRDDLLTMTPLDIKPEFDKTTFQELIEPLLDGSLTNRIFETRLRRRDGHDVPVEVTLQYVQDDHGSGKFVAIVRDITRKLQEESARSALECERSQLNRQLVESSRMAGMAQVAAGVLHNVGNVLNSINVSTDVLQRRVQSSAVTSLERLVQLLQSQGDQLPQFLRDDPRGKQIPDFLEKVTAALQHERRDLEHECQEILDNVEHIKEVINLHQSMAKSKTVAQPLDPEDLIRQALGAIRESLEKHGVQWETHVMDPVPTILSDKQRILQILINLVTNAKDSVISSRVEEPKIRIAVEFRDDHVQFSVQDNGIGIPAGDLEKIFQFGFTTKKHGNGFGLHYSANCAEEIEGTLTAASPGPGQGATFVLAIPAPTPSHLPAPLPAASPTAQPTTA